ncbi:MAG: EF2563 family selenium-dependent molybdenum hydroxylase system protein [Anaerolineae bacterium]|nr:EF2563 family selenium-dependent molybdenum hydroxylase system protein [Anaerolineae bacterium]MCI0608362.1 EF2563 family selenium-dependent molybdenum hydroxylase system protein [Anaerolineae bacterium]
MPNRNNALVLLRGGGDLATGVALRLHRAGIKLVITELPQPLAVRRSVSFSEAVYEGHHNVEGITARLVERDQIDATVDANEIPVLIDPEAEILTFDLRLLTFPVVIDARLIKQTPSPLPVEVPLHIGLGPGFHAGKDCHAVIETRRSHTLGRVYWIGTTQPDSGEPEGDRRRVLRAPADGSLIGYKNIGDHCEAGELIAHIQSKIENRKSEIVSPFKGVLRGLIRPGLHVTKGLKIGDVDPRDDPSACTLVSDKALAIGGGVLEAILSKEEIRNKLFTPFPSSPKYDIDSFA